MLMEEPLPPPRILKVVDDLVFGRKMNSGAEGKRLFLEHPLFGRVLDEIKLKPVAIDIPIQAHKQRLDTTGIEPPNHMKYPQGLGHATTPSSCRSHR